jgi:dimethylamine monooxygenase subunit C
LPRANPSRPVYSGLEPDPYAKAHLIAAESEGAWAVTDLFGKAPAAFAGQATILYVANPAADGSLAHRLEQLGANRYCLIPDIPSLLRECEHLLENATMGTAVYSSGTEGFIGQIAQLAGRQGVGFRSLRTEHRGSLARRVYCIHCKYTNEHVLTGTVTCAQCKVRLFVREHHSRRLNAFMGVSADAEDPSVPSPAVESS